MTISREQRIGACADYLLGKSLVEISHRWGVSETAVLHWISKTGSFKMRRREKENDNATAQPAS